MSSALRRDLLRSISFVSMALAVALTSSSCGGGDASTPAAHTVTYDGNGSTGGTVPVDSSEYEQGQTATVLGNTGHLVMSGYTFMGWNTQVDGNGAAYLPGQELTLGSSDVVLYVKWVETAACGGVMGLTCPVGQTCDIQGSCGVSDASGTCVLDVDCDSSVDPVCGCNGVTYQNDCLRLEAGVSLDHVGACT